MSKKTKKKYRSLVDGTDVVLGHSLFQKLNDKGEMEAAIMATESTIPALECLGLIEEWDFLNKLSTDIQYYEAQYASRMPVYDGDINIGRTILIQHAKKFDRQLYRQIILKQIAIEIDKRYQDHIRKVRKVYYYDNLRGKLKWDHTNQGRIENGKRDIILDTALFRSEEEAKAAVTLLNKMLHGK
jgi:hypothetical protein